MDVWSWGVKMAKKAVSYLKRPKVKLLGLKREFQDHTVASWQQTTNTAWTGQNVQYHPQNATVCSVRQFHSCYIGNQPIFHQMTLSKVIRAQKGSLDNKVATRPKTLPELVKKTSKITRKVSRSALTGDLTAVSSAINQSIFNKIH